MCDRFKGAIFLSLVIVIWVGSAVLIQQIFTSEDADFNKPFFLTYFNTAFFMVYLLPLAWDMIKKSRQANNIGTAVDNSIVSNEA